MTDLKLASAGDDIKLWECSNYTLVKQYNPHDQNVTSFCWNDDGTFLGSVASSDDKISLTFVKNASVTTTELDCEPGCLCLDFNSNSRFLLTGGSDGIVCVWDLKTRKLKKSYKDNKGPVTAAKFNWNDSYIASGSETGEIILYNVVTGQGSSPLVAPKVQAIKQLQYSNFKKSLLAAASDDGAVNLWDTNTRRLLHSFSDIHRAPVTGIAFSPINEMLMMSVGLDKRIVCYDVQGQVSLKVMTAESPLTSIDLLSDGATVAVGSTRGKIYIYDLRQGMTPVRILSAHKSSVQCLKFQPNPKSKKVGSGNMKTGSLPHGLNRRQLPLAPKPASQMINQQEQNHVVEKIQAADNSSGMVDMFSPIREASENPLTAAGGDMGSRSSGDQSSKQDDSYLGIFSPKTNLSGDSSAAKRYNFSGRVLSPLVDSPAGYNSAASQPAWSSEVGISSEAEVHRNGNTKTAKSSEFSADPPLTNGSAELIYPLSHRDHSPKDVSASPSVQTVHVHQSGESHGEGADGSTVEGRSNLGQSYSFHGNQTPRSVRASNHVDSGQATSPQTFSTQTLRHMVKDAMKEYTENMQEELKSMWRQATVQNQPHQDTSFRQSEASVFQTEFTRNLIREALEEFREDIHKDMRSLHMEVLRQFQIQQAEILSVLHHHSVNRELVGEVERLREENKRLKKHF